MSANGIRGKAAVVGVAIAGCGEAAGYTEMEILAQAAHAALAEAGLRTTDVDAVYTASVSATMWTNNVCEYLGIHPAIVDGTTVGGSSFVGHLLNAALAIAAGVSKVALICYGSTQRTGLSRGDLRKMRLAMDPYLCETPYAPLNPPSSYAMAAARHMHDYGTTREQLAEVAVAARSWAQRNPEAFMRDPLTIAEVLASRMVSDPLTVRDCCLVTDGAGAVVLTSADFARTLPQKPVYLLGAGMGISHRQISSAASLTHTAAIESGKRAYAMAGVAPKDVDVLALYDAFTINTILFLEDLGFCPKGEGGRFVEGGRIGFGGELAVNTNGGGLSCVHPGMYGIFTIIEAARQLRGGLGERQVKDVEIALVHGNGGVLSAQATAIFGTQAAL
ncbi:MAG: acetyl-CoA acetyltransferase [Candidatus Protistobacter heckmanni]|nr:acetyl-CoA acetyltransferase [Candidatus Protistobacter heckmanni]